MSRFRKKPIVIEAFQWQGEPVEGFERVPIQSTWHNQPGETQLVIPTLEGTMYANIGDYIITGVKGEVYPCKPDIFEATYESAVESRLKHIGLSDPDYEFVDEALSLVQETYPDESERAYAIKEQIQYQLGNRSGVEGE